MQKIILHKANTRGRANHGWLDTRHTFSFADYYEPTRIHFGALRVLNDDDIAGGGGFGMHPHDNMEIITIPLQGDLEHKDSMGNIGVIRYGEVQVMSAGTGIMHSEYNKNSDKPVKLLQIWVFPHTKNVTPRYDQLTLNIDERHNQFQQILSPNPNDAGVWIHQNAWFFMGIFEPNYTTEYTLKDKTNGIYIFVISGDITINNQVLNARDGFGISEVDSVTINVQTEAEILIMEVPMTV